MSDEEKLQLMALFRQDMQRVDPVGSAREAFAAFKYRPLEFKYAYASFLFLVWLAGREQARGVA